MLDEEDKQIIDMLDKKTKERVLNLIKEIDVLYEILSEMEENGKSGEYSRLKLQKYEKLESLESEVSKILKNFWNDIIRKNVREHKEVYKKFKIMSKSR